MSRSKLIWIIIFVAIIASAGGFYYYTTQATATESAESEQPAMQTAVARRGDLIIYASGAGSVIPAAEISLGFDESGTLIDLPIQVGDRVQAGDVLARLRIKETPEEIAASIAEAELSVKKAQKTLDDLYANAKTSQADALTAITQYATDVRDSQYQLDNYTIPSNLADMDALEALETTHLALQAASEAFAPYKYLSSSNETRQQLLTTLNEAQSDYNAAVRRLEYETNLAVASANLDKAQADYEKYSNGPDQQEVELAEAELANAQARLELAQQTKSEIELVAPSAGTILAVDANVGENLGASAFITLANIEQPLLEVYLDETDLGKIATGYEAEAVFDALPDQIFSGEVIAVDPSLQTVSGVQAVKTLVLLSPDEGQAVSPLPIGLNASVDIIGGRAAGAVLVPVESLRELGPDEYAVFVVVDGEPKLRVVEVGLVDITFAEIISGLEPGEVVSTGIVQTE